MTDNEERWEVEGEPEEQPKNETPVEASEEETDPDWARTVVLQQQLADIMTNLPDFEGVDGWEVARAMAKTIEALEQLADSMESILSVARSAPMETIDDVEQVLRAFLPLLNVFPGMLAQFLYIRHIVENK